MADLGLADAMDGLTPVEEHPELQVLRLLRTELSGPEIARELFVSLTRCAPTTSTSSESSR
jgi:ATP/maltotriose-dependent transcriptional regulator MalT